MAKYSGDGSDGGPSAAGAIPNKFPEGMRVLIVDDDQTCLMILEKKLLKFKYEVTACTHAEIALSLLRENKNGFDVVISDVHMPDMDGFKLLEQIGLEMDLPVIMMSADDSKTVVMKGVTHGACDYLVKPVRNEALKTIWQHVVRKNMKTGLKELEPTGSMEEISDYSSLLSEENSRSANGKRKNYEEDDGDEKQDNASTLKKPRVVWTAELHKQFVAVVNQLGLHKAVPKKILEMMNVPWLTRENVASHLQKYRMFLRRLSESKQNWDNVNSSLMEPQDASFSAVSLVTGNGSISPSTTIQGARLGRPTATLCIPRPVYRRFHEGQSQHDRSTGAQMNLLDGIPMTSMEPKPLVSMDMQHLGANVGPCGQTSTLLTQMARLHPREQILNKDKGNRITQLPSPTGQPALSNGFSGGVTEKDPVQQTFFLPNLPSNHNASKLPGNSFPLEITVGMSAEESKGAFREEVNVADNCDAKVSPCFTPSYDIFEYFHEHKLEDWEIQDIGLPDISESVFLSQTQMDVQISNASVQGETMFLPEEGSGKGDADNTDQRFKQQKCISPAENVFGFDEYCCDNNPL